MDEILGDSWFNKRYKKVNFYEVFFFLIKKKLTLLSLIRTNIQMVYIY